MHMLSLDVLLQRAVLGLRESLDFSFADIAAVVGKSDANCRQIERRARQRLADGTRGTPAVNGALHNVVAIDVADRMVKQLFVLVNPDKLRHLL